MAGDTAREHARKQERILSEASEILGVQSDDLPKAVQKFFQEWKSQQKKISNLEAEIVRLRTTGGGDEDALVIYSFLTPWVFSDILRFDESF